jgi:hypothetical protein
VIPSNLLKPHDLILVLEWTEKIDYDLNGIYAVGDNECIVNSISKPCGGKIDIIVNL